MQFLRERDVQIRFRGSHVETVARNCHNSMTRSLPSATNVAWLRSQATKGSPGADVGMPTLEEKARSPLDSACDAGTTPDGVVLGRRQGEGEDSFPRDEASLPIARK
jgi:hypothetical protein